MYPYFHLASFHVLVVYSVANVGPLGKNRSGKGGAVIETDTEHTDHCYNSSSSRSTKMCKWLGSLLQDGSSGEYHGEAHDNIYNRGLSALELTSGSNGSNSSGVISPRDGYGVFHSDTVERSRSKQVAPMICRQVLPYRGAHKYIQTVLSSSINICSTPSPSTTAARILTTTVGPAGQKHMDTDLSLVESTASPMPLSNYEYVAVKRVRFNATKLGLVIIKVCIFSVLHGMNNQP